jgi:putative phosphoesterase
MAPDRPLSIPIRIGVIADTHVRRFSDLPQALVKALSGCDLIIHAGDIVGMDVIRGLQSLAPVHAVHGNMCQPDAWSGLPYKLVVEAAGRRIGISHGSGGPGEAWQRVRQLFPGVDVIIFGHTHEAMNITVDGVMLFNPGRASESYGVIEIGEEIKSRIVRDYY